MSKLKSPLLSLGARGTIADTLTYQARGRDYVVREKPIPKDPYSLNQAYQRWDYRDYAYLWTLLTNSEKQVYRTKASKYHITGFSQWMRENLKDLPNLAGRWHLDERSGATAYDTSKQGNDGTIFGATPSTGVINGGYYFDGINDYINCGAVVPDTWSIEAFILLIHVVPTYFCGWSAPGPAPAIFLEAATGRPLMHMEGSNYRYWVASALDLLKDGLWHHICFTIPGSAQNDIQNSQLYIDGQLQAVHATNVTNPQLPKTVLVLGTDSGTRKYKGYIDHFKVYDRVLDATEILRHSERRYPQ